MIRDRCTQDEILISVVKRLIDSIPEFLNDQTCFLSDQPIPLAIIGGRYTVTVSAGSGKFPHEFFTGGGVNTTTEQASIVVTPLVVTPQDRPRRKFRKIVGGDDNSPPSLLFFKHAILKSLLSPSWEPKSEDGERLVLRDMLSPVSADDPRDVRVGETVAAAMQIRFATTFDWNLD